MSTRNKELRKTIISHLAPIIIPIKITFVNKILDFTIKKIYNKFRNVERADLDAVDH